MSTFFLIAILLLGFLVTFQIAKASEYVGILKGEKKNFEQNNRINGFLLLLFLILGLIGVYWCNELLKGRILGESASDHGVKIDNMLYITIAVTGVVFIITQVLLFWFSYRYQYKETRKVFYFPHDNKLELIWTVVPAIALSVLVGFGLYYWYNITGNAPKDAMVVEVTGRQFAWIYRYPGKDGVFGKKYYKNISDVADNSLGLIWSDTTIVSKNPNGEVASTLELKADRAAQDDIVSDQTLYLIKGKPVKMIIGARDVVHDVGLAHFRMKMDAVPGTPTTMWFTPLYTTKEMKKMTNNPDFVYEISCDQMCGSGHFSMRGVIEVVTQEEFDVWMARQKPKYYAANPDKDPANNKMPSSDSTIVVASK